MNEFPEQLRIQYLDKTMDSMNEAGTASNMGNSMIGLGIVNRFQFGVGVSSAYRTKETLTVAYRDIGVLRLPSAGVSLSPTLTAGFNLGWLLRRGPFEKTVRKKDPSDEDDRDEDDDEEEDEKKEQEEINILNRFHIFLHGMNMKFGVHDFKGYVPEGIGLTGSFSLTQYGASVRYQAMMPKPGTKFFQFMGITAGIGANIQRFGVGISETSNANSSFIIGPFAGSWVANSEFNYSVNIKSFPADLRTGAKFFQFLTVFGGLGINANSADSYLRFHRGGVLRLSADPSQIAAASLLYPSLAGSLKEILNKEGYLDVNLINYRKDKSTMGFAVFGIS
ncbi:MAG TPA: hypothetical protein PKA14_14830, partial [Leptospiraceae bacterium]|nr:hypothetical protein [Leptospiraceae bacterium]